MRHQEGAGAIEPEGAQSTPTKASLMTMVALKQRAEKIRNLEAEVAEKNVIISGLKGHINLTKENQKECVPSTLQVIIGNMRGQCTLGFPHIFCPALIRYIRLFGGLCSKYSHIICTAWILLLGPNLPSPMHCIGSW